MEHIEKDSENPSSASLSIAELVAQAASEVVDTQRSELFAHYTFVPDYGMWWSERERLYYDPNSHIFSSPDTGKYFYHDGEDYQPYSTQPSQPEKPKWQGGKKFERAAIRLLGFERVSAMDQCEVESTEVVLDLVERCVFLAGESSPRKKRPGMGHARAGRVDYAYHGGGYVDLDLPDEDFHFQPRTGMDEGEESESDDEGGRCAEYEAAELERRRFEGCKILYRVSQNYTAESGVFKSGYTKDLIYLRPFELFILSPFHHKEHRLKLRLTLALQDVYLSLIMFLCTFTHL